MRDGSERWRTGDWFTYSAGEVFTERAIIDCQVVY